MRTNIIYLKPKISIFELNRLVLINFKSKCLYTRPPLYIVDWRTAAQGQKEYTVEWIYSLAQQYINIVYLTYCSFLNV